MEIIVGRKGEQPFSITDKTVSGKHLKLTIQPNGKVQVEDLGSSNGTFIDGVRIMKKEVSCDTIVRMGTSYTFRISDVIPNAPKPNHEVEYSIAHLKDVWEEYDRDNANIREKQQRLGKKRMLPMMVGSAAGVMSAVFALIVPIGNIVSLPVAIVSFYLYFRSYKEKDTSYEDTKAAKAKLIKGYVCPNCHRTLPMQEYSIISQSSKCPYCGCKWTTKPKS